MLRIILPLTKLTSIAYNHFIYLIVQTRDLSCESVNSPSFESLSFDLIPSLCNVLRRCKAKFPAPLAPGRDDVGNQIFAYSRSFQVPAIIIDVKLISKDDIAIGLQCFVSISIDERRAADREALARFASDNTAPAQPSDPSLLAATSCF